MDGLYIATAFAAGVVSFLSPCVLPIIPGFLAYLAGSSTGGSGSTRRSIFINALFFVFGFSTVFAALGVLLQTVLFGVGYEAQIWLARAGGAAIIFFGLYLTGLVRVRFLDRDYKLAVKTKFNSRYATSFVFGMAFAAGWTPCAGAVLGSILGLAASAPVSAFVLLFSYAIGLGLPFLLVGAFTGEATALIARAGGSIVWVNRIFGVLLIALGVLVFTGNVALLGNFSIISSLLTR
jgi:cytochrome c-type biogenesis protein